MGKFQTKLPSKGYIMTSVNLAPDHRRIIRRVMKREGMNMGQVIRSAIVRLGEAYSHLDGRKE